MTAADRQEVLDWLARIAEGSIDLTVDNQAMAAAATSLLRQGYAGLVRQGYAGLELPEGHLTEHFTLAEMTHSDTANSMGIPNEPDAKQTENLQRLCEVLEEIRALCGSRPVVVSSGYRCPQLNAAVGGVSSSAHVHGLAADITIPAYGNPTQICAMVEPWLAEWGIDQLIDEAGGGARWVHVGLCEPPAEPRCECFAIG